MRLDLDRLPLPLPGDTPFRTRPICQVCISVPVAAAVGDAAVAGAADAAIGAGVAGAADAAATGAIGAGVDAAATGALAGGAADAASLGFVPAALDAAGPSTIDALGATLGSGVGAMGSDVALNALSNASLNGFGDTASNLGMNAATAAGSGVDPAAAADLQAQLNAETAGGQLSPSNASVVQSALSGGKQTAASSTGGALSKGLNTTVLALSALAGLGSALSRPKASQATPGPSSTAATQGPLFNAPLHPSGFINRTPTAPANFNSQTAGFGPEPVFFQNNQLHFARGGALHRALMGMPRFAKGGALHHLMGGDIQTNDTLHHFAEGGYADGGGTQGSFPATDPGMLFDPHRAPLSFGSTMPANLPAGGGPSPGGTSSSPGAFGFNPSAASIPDFSTTALFQPEDVSMFAPNLNFTPFVASASPAAASSSGSGGSGSQFTPGQGYNTPAPPAPTPAATRAFPDMGGPPGVALTPAEQQQADAFVQQGVDPQTAADWVVFGGTGPDYPGTANKAHGGPTHPLAHFMEARGGGARMVRGPSPGQADDVNAKLSDSEYVIDATTLADAGDGNPDAGARWFDQLREAIRHDKGRDKTPSPKIKSPLHYVHQLRRAA